MLWLPADGCWRKKGFDPLGGLGRLADENVAGCLAAFTAFLAVAEGFDPLHRLGGQPCQ